MRRLKLFSIKGEFGVWQIHARNPEEAREKLERIWEKQDRKAKAEEDLRELVEIPRSWFSYAWPVRRF